MIDYEYPEGTLYFCTCDECKCFTVVDYVDEVCGLCEADEHQKELEMESGDQHDR